MEIVSRGCEPSWDKKKEATCRRCNSVLKYGKLDIEGEYYPFHIKCPVCSTTVVLLGVSKDEF
ncbi:MAG: hypothetical protein FWE53_02095 [Firmicutes bacterium]|nr:hypothetical protein [Bacillota bacterium]